MLQLAEVPASQPALSTNPYQPHMARIVRIFKMVEDNYLFTLRFLDDHLAVSFRYRPGQFLMLSVPGAGEAPISISSSPSRPGVLEVCVRRVGRVTNALYRMKTNDVVGDPRALRQRLPHRGDRWQRPPVRRRRPGHGAAALAGLVRARQPRQVQQHHPDVRQPRRPARCCSARSWSRWSIAPTSPACSPWTRDPTGTWKNHVGLLPSLFDYARIDPARTYAAVCGPPVVYKFVLKRLLNLGFSKNRILMSLERRMKCGVGKCGHCSVGYKYTCIHGPIFTYWDAINLPEMI